MTEPSRPVLRWHGGKWRLAPWIIAHFPPHRVYVEPFGGAASVLLRKERAHAEVYNDLDDEVVDLFRVLRDPDAAERLRRMLALTPFARAEFFDAYTLIGDAVEDARRLVVRSFQGFGSNASKSTRGGRAQTGFRSNSSRSGTVPAVEWRNYPKCLQAIIDRMRGVIVENRDAIAAMEAHDSATTLHYVDPPYLHGLRSPKNPYDLKHFYRHELSDAQHDALLAFLRSLAGMVVVSGYPSPLYDATLSGWHRAETVAFADGARRRTEVLWLNPACVAAMERRSAGHGTPLFAEAAE